MDQSGTLLAADLAQRALADEWFAHYQYWFGSVVVPDKWENAILQFVEHSSDEYDHATELAGWLNRVPREGKIPRILPEVGNGKMYGCGFILPRTDEPRSLVEENLRGERCAIRFYTEFIDKISRVEYYGADLGNVLEDILAKEKEHAADLEKLLRQL